MRPAVRHVRRLPLGGEAFRGAHRAARASVGRCASSALPRPCARSSRRCSPCVASRRSIAVTIVAEVGQLTRFDPAQGADGLQRAGAVGGVERGQDPTRSHHQDGQQSPAAGAGRSRLALPIPARDVCRASSSASAANPRTSRRSPGRPSIDSTDVSEHSRRAASRSRESSRRSPESCSVSSGPSAYMSEQKQWPRVA